MAEWEMKGMEEFINLCTFTEAQLSRVCGKAIHPGAKIMADVVKQEIEALPVSTGAHRGKKVKRGISPRQKDGLVKSFGIAGVRRTRWGWNVKIGFDGYNDIVTKRWPQGQPNAMVARAVNSGTSFMLPNRFMDRGVRKSENATVKAIEDEFYVQLEKIWDK